jgi:hypothetical protein
MPSEPSPFVESQGLPPVTPPSGKFIAQLFGIPLLIVAFGTGILLAISWLAGGPHSPDEFIKKLDDSNPDVRWQAAENLAQVLLRDDQLAADSRFALNIADRLKRAVDDNRKSEAGFPERIRGKTRDDVENERRRLESEQTYTLFLAACLGNFSVPAGAPLLCDLAVKDEGTDLKAVARRRWRALWALANLGENVKRFDRIPPAQQTAALAVLEAEASSGEHASWAATALECLRGRQSKSPHAAGVDVALAQCARDKDPFNREMTAFALNFWEGTPEENKRMEDALVRLADDNGAGEDQLARFYDEEEKDTKPQESRAIGKQPGAKIRYNATQALARRGSERTPQDVLAEMLDEDFLRQNFVIEQRRKNNAIVPDENFVTKTLIIALKSTAELHRKNPNVQLGDAVRGRVQRLTESANKAVQTEAKNTLLVLNPAS